MVMKEDRKIWKGKGQFLAIKGNYGRGSFLFPIFRKGKIVTPTDVERIQSR